MATKSHGLKSILVLLMIGAFACGGGVGDDVVEDILEQQPGVEEVDIGDDEVSISFESEEGDVSMQMGTGDLPDDFPFPIAEGCEVVGSSTWEGPDGMAWQAGLEFLPEDFDAVVAFYEAFLEGEGFEVTRTITGMEADTMVMLLAERPQATASVVASRYDSGATANLTWGPGSSAP